MKKKVLFTILLIIILLISVYIGYIMSKKISTKKVDKKFEIIIKESNKNELTDEIIEKIEEKNVVLEQKSEEKTTEVIKANPEVSNSSASKSNSMKSSKNKQNKSSTSKVKENIKTVQESKSEGTKTENYSSNDEETKIEVNKPKEDNKIIEIVVEEPKESDYKNDPEYIKMKKELFSSKNECLKKGIDLNFSDSENIASTMCTSESYKGNEVGFRLYIRYKDGTYKEYKK